MKVIPISKREQKKRAKAQEIFPVGSTVSLVHYGECTDKGRTVTAMLLKKDQDGVFREHGSTSRQYTSIKDKSVVIE